MSFDLLFPIAARLKIINVGTYILQQNLYFQMYVLTFIPHILFAIYLGKRRQKCILREPNVLPNPQSVWKDSVYLKYLAMHTTSLKYIQHIK